MAKHVVGGKIYDTDLSTEVYSSYSGYKIYLYISENGNWFLYCDHVHSTWNHSHVKPLTADEACKYLHDEDEPDLLKEYFPDSIEDA